MGKKKREFPNTYVIIFGIILVCALATWLVPGGEYVKVAAGAAGETVQFNNVPSVGQWWTVMQSFYSGFTKQAGIICFILVIGASFWVVNRSKAIDAGIFSFLGMVTRLEKNKALAKIGVSNIVIVLIMLMFSLFGSIFGMSEETIAFVVIQIGRAHV